MTLAPVLFLAAACVLVPASPAFAQQPAASSPSPASKMFSQQELEQLLAPIALYPDALFAQILMASTYPLEVVAADRWVEANPGLKDKALEEALQRQPWDPSVKSLTVFPEVLTIMSTQIDWTQKLGDAFLAQQQDVLATAQLLRNKAVKNGALHDTAEQTVRTETVDATTIIKVEPANPQVVQVPAYDPGVVYGAWPYPAYPPYTYYPPGYAAGGMLLSFTAGAIVGSALWGDCNWGRGDVSVNVNRYNNFNRANISNRNWSHNVAHRGAVPYRDQRVAQRYGRAPSGSKVAAREQFRGRAEAGRDAIQRKDVPRDLSSRGTPGTRDRPAASAGNRPASPQIERGARSAFEPSAGNQARQFSNRGASSLASARDAGNFSGISSGGGLSGGTRGGLPGGAGGAGGGFAGGARGGGRR